VPDVAVTVPKDRWLDWLLEGDLPGTDDVWCPGPLFDEHMRSVELPMTHRATASGWDQHWYDEHPGDLPLGHEPLWDFFVATKPDIVPGERVYIIAHGRLRGYAPLVEWVPLVRGGYLRRAGGAVAVTLPEPIRGFQGWRYVWWDRAREFPFPEWQTEGIT
jgi:hypothetical protein